MKLRAADDDDGEGDREEEEEEGDVTESRSLRRGRGAHERNGAAITFRSTLKASADQGSKSRQSIKSLKEIICNTIPSYEPPPNIVPNAAAGAGAGAASSLKKEGLSAAAASFDDCVR